MNDPKPRLSGSAQIEASGLSAVFDQDVRDQASRLAKAAGKEFADSADVQEAWRLTILRYSKRVALPENLQTSEKNQRSIAHVCPECVNALFWAHRDALERVMNISNTRGEEEEAAKRRGMADAAFDCLSFFDGFYDCCLHYDKGTLKDHEVWVNAERVSIQGGRVTQDDLDPPTKEHLHLLNRLFLEFRMAFDANEELEHKRQDCLRAAKGLARQIAKLRYSSDPDFKGLNFL